MIDFTYSRLLFGIAILVIILIFLWRQKRGFWYLFFFSIFGLYLLMVASVIVFPIVPLASEDYVGTFKPSINLVPFYFGRCDPMPELCYRGIIQNIQLTIPFGFGINFIARLRSKDFLWLSILVGLVLEITQLVISYAFRSPFRAVDINDVILNAAGVLLGYGIFKLFGYLYLYITQKLAMHHRFVFAYIHDVVRQSTEH